MNRSHSLLSILWVAVALQSGHVLAAGMQETNGVCGPIHLKHYGPFDYRTQRDKIEIVDRFHFTPQVEALVRGQSDELGGDLNYVLKASPNHHRALIAMTRLGERLKSDRPLGADFTIACYYDRAIRYAHDDIIVRALFAQYLHKQGRTADGIKQLDYASQWAGDNGFSHYNVGLMYLELGATDQALREAWRAQALGFERPDLAAMLKRANKWREPAPSESSASAPAGVQATPGEQSR